MKDTLLIKHYLEIAKSYDSQDEEFPAEIKNAYPKVLVKILFDHVWLMAGLAGFEPAYDGIKTRCLTAWRQPNELAMLLNYTFNRCKV